MKQYLMAALISCLMMNAGSAMALYISDGTDIGVVDTIYKQTTLPDSGDGTEVTWVNTALSLTGDDAYTIDSFTKDNDLAGDWWDVFTNPLATIAAPDTYAYSLTATPPPEYYLVKIGGGNWSGDTHYLFENNTESDWAVIDLNIFGMYIDNKVDTIIDITRISHIGGTGAPVPEPATMLLFGTGLVGLAGSRLRKKKK